MLTEDAILNLLKQTPKSKIELRASFPFDHDIFDETLFSLEKNRKIKHSFVDDLFYISK